MTFLRGGLKKGFGSGEEDFSDLDDLLSDDSVFSGLRDTLRSWTTGSLAFGGDGSRLGSGFLTGADLGGGGAGVSSSDSVSVSYSVLPSSSSSSSSSSSTSSSSSSDSDSGDGSFGLGFGGSRRTVILGVVFLIMGSGLVRGGGAGFFCWTTTGTLISLDWSLAVLVVSPFSFGVALATAGFFGMGAVLTSLDSALGAGLLSFVEESAALDGVEVTEFLRAHAGGTFLFTKSTLSFNQGGRLLPFTGMVWGH